MIRCECSKQVASNTWKKHVRSDNCSLRPARKDFILNILNLKTLHRFAFLKKEGLEALSDKEWYLKVINGSCKLEDFSFVAPRRLGQNPPSKISKMSQCRKGSNNPAVKNKKKYNFKRVSRYAKKKLGYIIANRMAVSKLYSLINKKFPDFMFSFTDIKVKDRYKGVRGANKRNVILSKLCGINILSFLNIVSSQRGVFIKKGQDSSPNMEHSVKSRFKNITPIVSKSQIRLHKLILKIDPKAKLEYRIPFKDTWRSFDIYSPKYNALIEMHGRIWHDVNKTTQRLKKVVQKNCENDKIKKDLAISVNMRYIEFWDDEESLWETQIFNILGVKIES